MVAACISIFVIIIIMSFMFFRAKRKDYAKAILPLISVPLAHSIASGATVYIAELLGVSEKWPHIAIGIDMTALLVGGVFLGISSKLIEPKRSRNFFVILSMVFMVILTWVLASSILDQYVTTTM